MKPEFHAFQDSVPLSSIEDEDLVIKSDISEHNSVYDDTTNFSFFSRNNFFNYNYINNLNQKNQFNQLNQLYEMANKSDYALLFEISSENQKIHSLTFHQFKEIIVTLKEQKQEDLNVEKILFKIEAKGIIPEFVFQYIQRYQRYLNEYEGIYRRICTLDYFKGFCTHMFQSFENNQMGDANLISILIDANPHENRHAQKSINFLNEFAGINTSEKEKVFIRKIYRMQIELLEENLCKSHKLLPSLDKNYIKKQFTKLNQVLNKETMNPSETLIMLFPKSEEMFKEKLETIVIKAISKYSPSKVSVSSEYLDLFLQQYLMLKRDTQLLWINYLYTHICLMYIYKFHIKSIKKELELSLLYYLLIVHNNNEDLKSRVASLILRIYELQVEKYNQYKKIYIHLFSSKLKKIQKIYEAHSKKLDKCNEVHPLEEFFRIYYIFLDGVNKEGSLFNFQTQKNMIGAENFANFANFDDFDNFANFDDFDNFYNFDNCGTRQIIDFLENINILQFLSSFKDNIIGTLAPKINVSTIRKKIEGCLVRGGMQKTKLIFEIKRYNPSKRRNQNHNWFANIIDKLKAVHLMKQNWHFRKETYKNGEDNNFNFNSNNNNIKNIMKEKQKIYVDITDQCDRLREAIRVSNLKLNYSGAMKKRSYIKIICGLYGFLNNQLEKESDLLKKLRAIISLTKTKTKTESEMEIEIKTNPETKTKTKTKTKEEEFQTIISSGEKFKDFRKKLDLYLKSFIDILVGSQLDEFLTTKYSKIISKLENYTYQFQFQSLFLFQFHPDHFELPQDLANDIPTWIVKKIHKIQKIQIIKEKQKKPEFHEKQEMQYLRKIAENIKTETNIPASEDIIVKKILLEIKREMILKLIKSDLENNSFASRLYFNLLNQNEVSGSIIEILGKLANKRIFKIVKKSHISVIKYK